MSPGGQRVACTDAGEWSVLLVIALTNGLVISETSMPIVPACGAGVPVAYSPRQVPKPATDEAIAPAFVIQLQRIPHTNGPRNAAPIAPHEIERMDTMVAGRRYARTTDKHTKPALHKRIKRVRRLSETPLLTKPA